MNEQRLGVHTVACAKRLPERHRIRRDDPVEVGRLDRRVPDMAERIAAPLVRVDGSGQMMMCGLSAMRAAAY